MKRRTFAVLMAGLYAVSLSVSSNAIFGSSKMLSEREMNETRGKISMLYARVVSCNEATWPWNPRAYDCNETPTPLSCNNCEGGTTTMWMTGGQAGYPDCPGNMEETNLTDICGWKFEGKCVNGECVNTMPPGDLENPAFKCRTWNFSSQGYQ